jgi:methionine-S-sulfoxide reductase
MRTFVLAGGCFWCLDAVYRTLRGVKDVVSGYTGGDSSDPTYELVCTGTTGHAEAVKVVFDESVIPAPVILDVFFSLHDPRQLDRQGNDVGTQYRSAMFYADDAQRQEFEDAKDRARHRDRSAGTVVGRRGVPPGLLHQEPRSGLLSRRRAAQGQEDPRVLLRVRAGLARRIAFRSTNSIDRGATGSAAGLGSRPAVRGTRPIRTPHLISVAQVSGGYTVGCGFCTTGVARRQTGRATT